MRLTALLTDVADERTRLLYADDALPPEVADSGYDEDSLRSCAGSQAGRRGKREDEYYDFADYSAQTGQEPEVNSGDERTDWSSEQWARPSSPISLTDEAETEPPAGAARRR